MINSDIKGTLLEFEQEHVLQFWPSLSETERNEFVQVLKELNVKEVTSCFKAAMSTLADENTILDDDMKPISPSNYGAVTRSSPSELNSYNDEGLNQISEGKVGVILMAGGQGTRLGVSYPKGMFDVGLPSHKSLFQIQAERILKLNDIAYLRTGKNGRITWYIMTSDATMELTKQFLDTHQFFGLDKENVVLFEQGLLPCFTFDGKLIMDNRNQIARAPDGNGGLYKALKKNKILDDLDSRGIEFIHVHGVDNILVKVADPVFIGYCIHKGADCGAKVVEKVLPNEAVGVICVVDGRYRVVEYTEISNNNKELVGRDGRLIFNAGNICNHFFTRQFLHKIANIHENDLPLHVAKKKIPYIDSNGNLKRPEKPNGIKMEKFVFDVFQFADHFAVWEGKRWEEFSPLKNADNPSDLETPTTARNSIYLLHYRYIKDAGGTFSCSPGNDLVCEISPLVTYAGEGLELLVRNRTFSFPFLLQSPTENISLNRDKVTCECEDKT